MQTSYSMRSGHRAQSAGRGVADHGGDGSGACAALSDAAGQFAIRRPHTRKVAVHIGGHAARNSLGGKE